jgi:hypothetical protein
MQLRKRVEGLEARTKPLFERVHRIIQHVGETRDQALDAYGRHLIGENDLLIVNVIVSPCSDA